MKLINRIRTTISGITKQSNNYNEKLTKNKLEKNTAKFLQQLSFLLSSFHSLYNSYFYITDSFLQKYALLVLSALKNSDCDFLTSQTYQWTLLLLAMNLWT